MYYFETHCHSNHSKGTSLPTEAIPRPRDIIRHAKKIGLSGITLSDHNVITGWKEAREEAKKQGIIFIPGIELNTLSGHLVGLGVNEHIKRDLSIDESIEKIHEQGGIAIAVHPFDIKGDGVGREYVKADAVEIFNAINLDRFSNFLIKKKAKHKKIAKLAGSDAHTVNMIGRAQNRIDAQSVDEFLKQVKKGNVEHVKRYQRINEIQKWSRQRFEGSYELMMQRALGYPHVKQWLARNMLRKFVRGEGRPFFDVLGKFSIFCTIGYGAVKYVENY